jgi:CheY-like chemotaxis protein
MLEAGCAEAPSSSLSESIPLRPACDINVECVSCDPIGSAGYLMILPNSSSADETAGLNGIRILVVEDSWDVTAGLKMLLETWGVDTVCTAATADDARRLASECIPDVALVDINLRNGEQSYDLIDWLHERSVRIVVISGYPDVSLAKDKAIAILSKPVREELLLSSLRSVTQG